MKKCVCGKKEVVNEVINVCVSCWASMIYTCNCTCEMCSKKEDINDLIVCESGQILCKNCAIKKDKEALLRGYSDIAKYNVTLIEELKNEIAYKQYKKSSFGYHQDQYVESGYITDAKEDRCVHDNMFLLSKGTYIIHLKFLANATGGLSPKIRGIIITPQANLKEVRSKIKNI